MQWEWFLGIVGVTSQQQNPDYTYTSSGTYPISLQVRSLNGCKDVYFRNVSVSENPRAGFSGMEVCKGIPLLMSDTSVAENGSIIERQWKVEGFGTLNDSTISVLFPDSGNYSVSLYVTSELYCSDSVQRMVRVHPLPIADFEVDKDFGAVPLFVQFSNESSNGNYFWQFGDGSNSSLTDPQHIYLAIGDYSVLMNVTDSNGCVRSKGTLISVVPNLYDLVIFGMDTVIQGSVKKTVLYLANAGSLPIVNPLALMTVDDQTTYSETINMTLSPGAFYSYTLSSGQYLPEGNKSEFICARVLLPDGLPDANMSNNEYCITRSNQLSLLRVYPNPANEELIIEFSVDEESSGKIQITNTAGHRVLDREVEMKKGFNRISLNVSDYSQGMYFLNLRDASGNIFYKFAKN
jgi:PKD repeat protein